MLSGLEKTVGIIASAFLFLMMMITLVDVIGRQVFNHPIAGGTEITEITLVVITFLVYPIIAFRRKHITVDIVDTVLGPRARMVQRVVTGLLGAFIFACLAWRLWILGDRSASYGDTTAYLLIPIGPVFWFMSIMSALTALAFIALMFSSAGDNEPAVTSLPGAD
ncbi:TRAP-type C4-dicarboxylate transport system permease small subunit [Rhodoligotrophos appendicifer]|uniref:TRAP transporter small permease n=1 Tax=Rhodoligotrophos appendicifer TaxID=987056 RepID=UPI00117CB79D|nr:TRAP transporter small permease [Rhodoligotrophos appendicifer]